MNDDVVENADEPDNRLEGANDEATESESGIPDEEKSVACDGGNGDGGRE